jgi:hypothetical protein
MRPLQDQDSSSFSARENEVKSNLIAVTEITRETKKVSQRKRCTRLQLGCEVRQCVVLRIDCSFLHKANTTHSLRQHALFSFLFFSFLFSPKRCLLPYVQATTNEPMMRQAISRWSGDALDDCCVVLCRLRTEDGRRRSAEEVARPLRYLARADESIR